ncbi:hypothetical protein [Shouchella hunanensis]|uniref:Tail fiber protein n=1 Tax=Shouchella hunanensis TaxID=766894 RepID=A0ABY7WBD5_9BACI|nr:hypothetical protein [Shouchella hunanensis]WDF05170.1 hypothetical protein PQ477_06790 [Shouchella hunanensis]GAF23042.1 LOW QUALITY PROTEIN: hypothetical protein JCM19047_2831 [Bacillus sp. JCM 19047]
MAQTPYKDLKSEAILSAHLSGVQQDINKIQQVLNMKSTARSNAPLIPVSDQTDPTLRFRIYEGEERNWLDQPVPVLYRDGALIDAGEYELYPPYGAVVFAAQQHADSVITADYEAVANTAQLSDDVLQTKQSLEDLKDKIDAMASAGGGVEPFYPTAGTYLSHFRRDYNPFTAEGYNVNSHVPAFSILVYGDTLDAFPFPVTRKTKVVRAGMSLGSAGNTVAAKVGIYSDDGTGRPKDLLFESEDIEISSNGGWGYVTLDEELEEGLYWIARHDRGTAYWNGFHQRSVIPIVRFNGEVFLRNLAERPNPHTVFGGYRATNIPYGQMPTSFPESGELFRRDFYASPWLITG